MSATVERNDVLQSGVIDIDTHTRITGGFPIMLKLLPVEWREPLAGKKLPAQLPGHRNLAWNHAPHFAADWSNFDPKKGYAGSNRMTSITPDGGLPGSDPQYMIDDHFEPN